MKTDVLVELKALRLHGMAGAWADLVEEGGGEAGGVGIELAAAVPCGGSGTADDSSTRPPRELELAAGAAAEPAAAGPEAPRDAGASSLRCQSQNYAAARGRGG